MLWLRSQWPPTRYLCQLILTLVDLTTTSIYSVASPLSSSARKIVGLESALDWDGGAHTGSRGASGEGPNQVESLGFLVYARYAASVSKKLGYYVNVGLGLQYSNQQTVDLSSKINSTPMLGVGLTWDTSNGEASLGLGLLHISNAGTVPPNQGQNQVYLMYGWRF